MKKLTYSLLFSLFILNATAQYRDLHNFDNWHGANPYGSLTFSTTKDTLFGLTAIGGANNAGVIFSINKNGTGYTDMLDFNFTNGANPCGSLTLSPNGKRLYGMTSYAGTSSFGTVFEINTDGTGFSTLYNFSGYDGAYPYGSLIFSLTADTLLGMTSYGGYGYGNIFSIDTDGTGFSDIYDFNGINQQPYGSLLLSPTGKYMFGTTSDGTSSYGNIFVINTDGTGYWDGLNFNGLNGAYPQGSLIYSVTGDSLFGMSSTGSTSSYGNLFTIGSSGFTDLLDFYGANGKYPDGDVTLAGGVLYGMTSQGGINGDGTVFSIHTNGSRYSDMLDFNSTNGSYPYGSLVFSNNVLYGMTSTGGRHGYGLIFSDTILSISRMEVKNVTCTSGPDGAARAFASGGVTPYTYLWLPGGATTQTITHLSMGTYTVIVADNTGSTATSIAIISGIVVSADIFRDISCYGGGDGAVIADVTWGTPPFNYSWSDGTTNALDNKVSAGTYTVTVSDKCATATASVTLTQPPLLSISLTPEYSAICYGDSVHLTTTTTGGTPPYTYFWFSGGDLSCTDCPNPTSTPSISMIDTVMVTDSNGCTAFAVDTVIVHPLPTPPIIIARKTDSTEFRISEPDAGLSYSWALDDVTGHYSGKGDTIYLPVLPRNAIFTVYAKDTLTACVSSTSLPIIGFPLPAFMQPYPRWSKRGLYLENCCNVIDSADSTRMFVNFCRLNHVTYVLLDGTSWFGGPCAVFQQDFVGFDTANAVQLENFIDSLKTEGGVEQVGVIVYQDTGLGGTPILDSNAASVEVYNVQNFSNTVYSHNLGLPWEKKIDYLSLDAEFWNYTNWLYLFHNWHMPMLKAMSAASHQCQDGYLRVEDYLEEPLNPGNIGAFNINDPIDTMMADSIALYADRILNSCYSGYKTALWNEADFRLAYPNFGKNPNKIMEIWPVFSAENDTDHISNSSFSNNCTICAYDSGNDFSGTDLCLFSEIDTAEWIERQYFDSLSFSERYGVFTSTISSPTPMGGDTNFTILGDAWFDYNCFKTENINFDTITNGPDRGYLRFYVTVGADRQWIKISVPPPITVTATVHGGKGPFTYTWYNVKNNVPLSHGVGSSYASYTTSWNDSSGYYNVNQLGVVVKNTGAVDSTVADYLNIYQICTQPLYFSPVKGKPNDSTYSQLNTIGNKGTVKVYPNPNNGTFTLALQNISGTPRIEIYSVLGAKVFAKILPPNQETNTINLVGQSNGIYFYRVLSETGKLLGSGKLVIEK